MPRPSRFSSEVRERAVRVVVEQTPAHDSPWAAIRSIAEKIGRHSDTLRKRVRDHERTVGHRPGPTAADSTADRSAGGLHRRPSCRVRRRSDVHRPADRFSERTPTAPVPPSRAGARRGRNGRRGCSRRPSWRGSRACGGSAPGMRGGSSRATASRSPAARWPGCFARGACRACAAGGARTRRSRSWPRTHPTIWCSGTTPPRGRISAGWPISRTSRRDGASSASPAASATAATRTPPRSPRRSTGGTRPK